MNKNRFIVLSVVCVYIFYPILNNKHKVYKHNDVVLTGKNRHSIIAYSTSNLKKSDLYNFVQSRLEKYPQFDTAYVTTIPEINKDSTLQYTITGLMFIVIRLRHNCQGLSKHQEIVLDTTRSIY